MLSVLTLPLEQTMRVGLLVYLLGSITLGKMSLYDETFESFKWLFETFLKAHNGKQPKTLYTDQDFAMGKVVKEVLVDACHGSCTFHIMQNVVKHLVEPDHKEESNILLDLSACMYEYEYEATFEHAFNIMRTKTTKQTWLDSIYKMKQKWVECYM
jgi:hypothetical protein